MKFLAITAGAVFIALNAAKIMSFLKVVISSLKMIGTKLLPIILIALLIEDFVNFMQGNDSLIGELFKKAGIDADGVRETVMEIWNTLKEIGRILWDTLWPVLKEIGGAFLDALKEIWAIIGDDVMNALKVSFEWISDKLKELAQWMKENPEKMRAIAEIILMIVAALVAFKIVMALVNAVMAVSPITWIILAIVALIAIIVLCVKYWDKIKEAMSKAWEWIKSVWGAFADWVYDNLIAPVVDFFKGLWDSIVSIFVGIIDWVKDNWQSIVLFILNPFAGVFKYLYDNFEGFRNFVDGIVNAIKEFFINLGTGIKDAFVGALNFVKDVWDGIIDFFKGIWDKIVEMFTKIGTAVGDAVGGAFKNVVNAVIGFVEKIINGFFGTINKAIGLINKIPGVNIPLIAELDLPKLEKGSNYTPDTFIAGDVNGKGGELVTGAEGRKVFTAAQTGDIFQTLKSIAGMAIHPRPETVAAATNYAENKSIIQNIEIQNKFDGDRAGQQKSETAMRKATDDITGTLARAISFGR